MFSFCVSRSAPGFVHKVCSTVPRLIFKHKRYIKEGVDYLLFFFHWSHKKNNMDLFVFLSFFFYWVLLISSTRQREESRVSKWAKIIWKVKQEASSAFGWLSFFSFLGLFLFCFHTTIIIIFPSQEIHHTSDVCES